jgi:hypothetical protein
MLFNSHGNDIELVKTGDRTERALSQRRERHYTPLTNLKMLQRTDMTKIFYNVNFNSEEMKPFASYSAYDIKYAKFMDQRAY